MRHIAVCVLVGILLAAGGCARRVEPGLTPVPDKLEPGSKLLRFDSIMHAGSPELAFHFVGSVEKREAGRQGYEYVVRSTVMIENGGHALPPRGVRLSRAVLTASAIADGQPQGRRAILKVEDRIDVRIKKAGETQLLPELRFTLPASVVTKSDYLTLVLTDGRLQVRVIPNLKGRKVLE